MSALTSSSVGYLSPIDNFSQNNVLTLGGSSQLWQDFFARALEDQLAEGSHKELAQDTEANLTDREPVAGAQVLAQIHTQRDCGIQDNLIAPPEPLFLPIAEFEWELMEKPAVPFTEPEMLAQQAGLDFDSSWVRPIVLTAGQAIPEPGPAPEPKPLFLPIAEFEWDLAEPAPEPFAEHTLIQQQRALEFDTQWARPVVLQNIRLAA